MSFGVVLVLKSSLGVSVGTSIPYILSLRYDSLRFGQWNYLVHGLALIILMVLLKRVKASYLLTFPVAFLFGLIIDFFDGLLFTYNPLGLGIRLGIFVLGTLIISFGLALFLNSELPVLPFDTFVKEISREKGLDIGSFKTAFDLACFAISLILSLIFFRRVLGLGLGTLLSALVIGRLVGIFLKLISRAELRKKPC